MKKNKAFTLLELLLSMTIMSILFFSVAQTMAYGMRVTKVARAPYHVDAMVILQQLNQSLQNTFVSPYEDMKKPFRGTAKSLRFSCVVPQSQWSEEAGDLQECSFVLEGGLDGTKKMVYQRGLGATKILQERILSLDVYQLSFRFFDGTSWKKQWSSDTVLPRAVEVTVRFNQDSKRNPFVEYKTTISIPCAHT